MAPTATRVYGSVQHGGEVYFVEGEATLLRLRFDGLAVGKAVSAPAVDEALLVDGPDAMTGLPQGVRPPIPSGTSEMHASDGVVTVEHLEGGALKISAIGLVFGEGEAAKTVDLVPRVISDFLVFPP